MGYTEQEMLEAAKVKPADRSPTQQAMVDAGKDIQSVRNTDFKANETQRAGR